ncbi:brassinosteroid-responsive RING-H2 [Actinidia rufa]|uniref:Brassinosteroid-responsive RING-H2 n=1 Tax=Actinidia rufa TaxID=165716 RepID=A0A7J0G7Q5_9ERIC|nr:brassinosteroid-responsive RING-H2 [Actinidia rufa]
MGFPVGYTEVFLPKLFIHILSLLGLIRALTLAPLPLRGLLRFPRTRNLVPGKPGQPRKPDLVGRPDPGAPAGDECSRRWSLAAAAAAGGRELCRVPLRVRGRGGDPVADELQDTLPPELRGSLDGPRSEHVSAL